MTSTLTRFGFTVADARALAHGAAWAARSIPTKPSPPILGGMVLEVESGALRMSGFDFDVCGRAEIPAEGEPAGRVLVSGRLFADLAKTLPGKPVTASADDTALTLRCGTVRLSLPLMTGEDYPALPDAPTVLGTVDAQEFATLAERVVVATDLRGQIGVPALTGVYLAYGPDAITAMGSNRYRGAVGTVGWTPAETRTGGAALVPADVLVELARATDAPGELAVGLSGGLISFTWPGRSISARLLDAKDFPVNLPKLIPARADTPTVVSVAETLAAIKRAALVLEPKTPVRLRFEDGTVNISGGGPHADAGEDLACAHEGDPREVAVNVEYLSDALAVLGTATAELTLPPNDRKPVVVTAPGDDTYRYFAMPIRKG